MGRHGLQRISDYTTISSYQTGFISHLSQKTIQVIVIDHFTSVGRDHLQISSTLEENTNKPISTGMASWRPSITSFFFIWWREELCSYIYSQRIIATNSFFIQVWLKWNIVMYLLYKNKRELIASDLGVHLPYTKNCFDL